MWTHGRTVARHYDGSRRLDRFTTDTAPPLWIDPN